jgi:hypothetical protein
MRQSGWPSVASWALTLAAVVAVAYLGFSLLRQCTPTAIVAAGGSEARAAIASLADALSPTISSTPVVVLRGEDSTSKLVVHTHTADVEIDVKEDHWYGDTYSTVKAKGCKVQFIIPLDGISDKDLMFVPGSMGEPARIVIIAPRPKPDAEMLSIAPEEIEFTERNTGLRHARRWVGMDNRDALVPQLRPKLLEAVADPAVRARAEQSAREFLEKRLAKWLRGDLRLGRDVTVDVRWTE